VRQVFVTGIGMTNFGSLKDRTLRQLAGEAASAAISDAGLTADAVDAVYFANAVAGLMTGQEMIRGQAFLRDTGLLGKPIVNVENACASGSTALHLAVMSVASGAADVALAVGAELLTTNKRQAIKAIGAGVVLEDLDELKALVYPDGPPATSESLLMDIYARTARGYMQSSGATSADFAAVVEKNHAHGALNPKAHYQVEISQDEVLDSRMISAPLTLLMCSPITDGAAALLVCSPELAERSANPRVRVAASVLKSGTRAGRPAAVALAAQQAYEVAGIGPGDVDVIEVHDAAAPAEIQIYEEIGLCPEGDGPKLLASGATRLGGRIPVNTSGGLLSRGHPIAATGCAQIVELVQQLREQAGARQVAGARIALAENSGGYIGPDPAAACVTILERRNDQ
jgi:acetyl-CoA acetyltransferase